MPTDLQSRTRYLALAEFCQNIISSLSDYVEGTAKLPRANLKKALEVLQSARSGYPLGPKPALALSGYEQVRTIEDAWKNPQRAIKLAAELLGLSAGRESEGQAKAQKVIDLFSDLQAKALWNFEQPRRTIPPDARELCAALKTTQSTMRHRSTALSNR